MKRFAIACAATALCVAAAPAGAATIVVTAEGTLSWGRDDLNTLGLGTDLTGQVVSMVFTFNDERTDNMSWYEGPTGSGISGRGPDWGGGYDDSPGSAMVTIGGIELAILGDYESGHSVGYYPASDGWDSVTSWAGDQKYFYDDLGEMTHDHRSYANIQVSGLDILSGPDLLQNVNLLPGPDIYLSGGFNVYSWNYDPDAWGNLKFISGDLNPESMTYSVQILGAPTGAVPEPSTWAMMILGFGAVGGLMRRRQPVRVRYV